MARLRNRLSARKVASARPRKGLDSKLFADGGGLYLQATNSEPDENGRIHVNRSWLFKYELNHRRREMGLGPLYTRDLKSARHEAKAMRELLLRGVDPIEYRDKDIEAKAVDAAKDKTFAEVARQYLATHRDDWKNAKHAAQWETSLTKEAKAITNLPVAKIGTAHILQVLQPIWRSKPESASRTRGRIERVLAYAIAAQYRRREDGNPARWDGSLKELLGSKSHAQRAKYARTQKTGHHPALPYRDLPEFMTALRKLDSTSARALEFTILTAARTGETLGASWREFDLHEKTWAIPGNRMKMGKPHKVPLSDGAVEILKSLPHVGDKVFPLSNMAMLECVRGLRSGITVHGFRSSFADWAHEQTAFAKVVIDLGLAHAIGDKVEAAYRRGDLFEKRRQLMAQWSAFLASPPVEKATAKVTPIRRKAKAEVSA
jgi:integrase